MALAPCAHAQIFEAYATFSPTHLGNVQNGLTLASNGVANQYTYQTQYTSFFAPAIGGGITLNVIPLGPVRLGVDVRGSTKPGTNGVDSALAGIKLAVKPPLLPIKPYIQISGGYLATRSNGFNYSSNDGGTTTLVTGATITNKYAAIEGIAGIDYHLLPFVNFRIAEFGYGKGYSVGPNFSNNFGAVTTQNDLNFFTINTGLVVHF